MLTVAASALGTCGSPIAERHPLRDAPGTCRDGFCDVPREAQMAVSRYPCRSCGQLTDGEDAYVVCGGCLDELDAAAQADGGLRHAEDDVGAAPLAPHEVEAQLRKLLDDW